MPEIRVTDEQGNTHVFPDGSTPEMISKALNLKPPTEQPQPGFLARTSEAFGLSQHPIDQLGSELKQLKEHPVDTLVNTVKTPILAARDLAYGLATHPIDTVIGATGGREFAADMNAGNYRGALGTLAGKFGQVATAKLAPGKAPVTSVEQLSLENLPKGSIGPRGILANRMEQPVEAGGPTRAQVLNAASDKGVNLDLAQATDSGMLNGVKRANRYSIASQGTYDAATTKNVAALEKWADTEAASYAKEGGGREIVGPQIQQTLKADLAARKELASNLFDELDKKVGGAPNDVSGTVAADAQKIISENADYYAKHPELKPGKAWAILEDLASKTPGKAVAKSVGGSEVIDAAGNPIMQKGPAGGPKIATWQELHQLRSDLMDFYRNNPDIVKGRSEAWIQQMVGKIDEAMTSGTSGLSEGDLATFRKANEAWEGIKSTYDNNQHPYYNAVRTLTPSKIPNALANHSPELARSVRSTLGSLEGPFQRQYVENILNGKDGALDLKNLNSRLSRIPQDHLVSMIGETGAKNLRMLGRVSQKVMADANPSGTAKVGVPAAEVTGLFNNPIAGGAELGAQYVGAKAMNSPKLVGYLTKKK